MVTNIGLINLVDKKCSISLPNPLPHHHKNRNNNKKTPPLNLQSRRGNALKGQVHDSAHAC